MNSMFPVWLFLLLTIGAPLLWMLLDHLQLRNAAPDDGDRSPQLRSGT